MQSAVSSAEGENAALRSERHSTRLGTVAVNNKESATRTPLWSLQETAAFTGFFGGPTTSAHPFAAIFRSW